MISIAKPSQPDEQEIKQFEAMIPAITRTARIAFSKLPSRVREEAIQDVLANAFCAFARLAELGKSDCAFASPLARFAVARYWQGRQAGTKFSSQDVCSCAAQRRRGFALDSLPSDLAGMLVDDTKTAIPDQVAFRLDFPVWLRSQVQAKRQMAVFMAMGNSPRDAAKKFGVTQARVCQVRRELRTSWQDFQGETPVERPGQNGHQPAVKTASPI